MDVNVAVWFVFCCKQCNPTAVNVVFTYGFHDNILYLDVIKCGSTSLKVFHENILCAISSGDVTYDLFLYLSGFDLFVKTQALTAYVCCWRTLTINTFRVVFAV